MIDRLGKIFNKAGEKEREKRKPLNSESSKVGLLEKGEEPKAEKNGLTVGFAVLFIVGEMAGSGILALPRYGGIYGK